jgi:Holliday junction resolvase RusA-like endonuclease
MSGYTIVVSGEPRPEAKRQRFFKRKGGGVAVGARTDLPDRADWKAYVRHEARLVCDAPLEGPLTLVVRFTLVRPPSWSRRPTKAYPWPSVPYKKPDLDNLIKPVKDALTGIAWGDDAQVVSEAIVKCWGDRYETTIEVQQEEAAWGDC